ncbi:glycosyltransferase [Salmonirosea aquatica]|uniref:Glycosyltransferase n=1 Tax=Salmonirosea aquatica TaxID=2654236 RepID=A0A7C9BLM2_9BACT|nr:glycosyltransferase [Cytophagaceae bacterium SJW1-29]
MVENTWVSKKVSVLLAARNEEDSILRCLQALEQLNFPKAQLEILIGNDDSTDDTEQIVLDFIQDKSHFRYHSIQGQTEGLRGKANVLAQLAHQATGDYFFYCDADIAVAPTWIETMLPLFKAKVGVVVGVTRMVPEGSFSAMQSLEWLFSITAMRFFSLWEIPFTGMGNNMAVSRTAYWAVGGYEKIGFSIVEDFALFVAILDRGFTFVQGFQSGLVSLSLPVHRISHLLRQRKRWVKGAMQAPWPIKLSFFASAFFLPILLVLGLLAPGWCIGLAALHFLLVGAVCLAGLRILKQSDLIRYVPLFWLYFSLNNTVMLINYLLPTPTVWKGRNY